MSHTIPTTCPDERLNLHPVAVEWGEHDDPRINGLRVVGKASFLVDGYPNAVIVGLLLDGRAECPGCDGAGVLDVERGGSSVPCPVCNDNPRIPRYVVYFCRERNALRLVEFNS